MTILRRFNDKVAERLPVALRLRDHWLIGLMALLQHSLTYGLILSGLLTAVILASLIWNPAVAVGAGTPDNRARDGLPQARTLRQARVFLLPFVLLAVIGTLMAAVVTLPAAGLTPTFSTVFVSTFLIAFVFNLFDLLVIDWLVVVTWHPRWFTPPGEAGSREYGFHFRGFLKGLGFCPRRRAAHRRHQQQHSRAALAAQRALKAVRGQEGACKGAPHCIARQGGSKSYG